MKDPQLDLSPLDPDVDPLWRRRLGGSVMARVQAIATRPRAARPPIDVHDPIGDLLSLARPALIAASLIVAVCLGLRPLRPAHPSSDATQRSDPSLQYPLASAVGLAGPWARWVEEGRSPSAGEVLAAARGY